MADISVSKRQVEQYEIILPSGHVEKLAAVDAAELANELHSALGRMPVSPMNCTERYSHSAHSEINKGVLFVCRGRSQDAT